MENTTFPITIKKRNGGMIAASITEVLIGVVFGITQGGFASPLLWIFVFTGIITALSVWVEYSRDIILKENKMEFYKNTDLIKTIKYSDIKTITIDRGNEPKTKKKDFVTISIGKIEGKNKKNNDYKIEKYLVNPSSYGASDFIKMKDIIISRNSNVNITSEFKEFFKIK
ncbi:hypothetical protein [Clostridium sp. C2-6-12]|uniref:hypothetical protein n=1 Tax=Clostridium sp. C2-6-12 TaxID=2698832 RepID=UPI0013687628|nr:hypothetical protein [Clostridium sp. C2-6-12]